MREFASFILRSDSDIRAGDEAYIVKVTKKRGIPAFLFGFTEEIIRAREEISDQIEALEDLRLEL